MLTKNSMPKFTIQGEEQRMELRHDTRQVWSPPIVMAFRSTLMIVPIFTILTGQAPTSSASSYHRLERRKWSPSASMTWLRASFPRSTPRIVISDYSSYHSSKEVIRARIIGTTEVSLACWLMLVDSWLPPTWFVNSYSATTSVLHLTRACLRNFINRKRRQIQTTWTHWQAKSALMRQRCSIGSTIASPTHTVTAGTSWSNL